MKKHQLLRSFVLLTAFIFLQPALWANYFNDFEGSVGSEWSHASTGVTPIGTRSFLGQFGNDTVSLSLTDLGAHTSVMLSFDLFIIRSWDGNDGSYYAGEFMGPDIWSLQLRDGGSLLSASFSNSTGTTPNDYQSYPDNYPGGVYQGYTGAVEINTLGFIHPLGGRVQDSVYNLSFSVPHADSSLVLDFSALNLQELSDESWGLDNVSVTFIPEPCMLALMGLGGLLLKRKK
jgi:hypothetical protein